MLTAIANTTLLDDVFLEDPTTLSLESHIATLTTHPSALLVLSGTMGNQVALRTHLTQPPHSVLCDSRSHILAWEAGGVASLSGALVTGIHPQLMKNNNNGGHHITLEDVQTHAVLSTDVHACPTRVISLENTLNGTIIPLHECRRITSWARDHGIRTHLDGARLWEAVVAGAGSLAEYCSLFDSVSLCFSKGLGAPIGSILVGDEPFITRARWIRKAIGGGVRQAGVISAAARCALDETFGTGPWGEGGKLQGSHEMARRVAGMWEKRGGNLAMETESNMVWFDLEDAGCSVEDFVALGVREGVKVMGGRLAVHYQISEEAVERLGTVMDVVLKGRCNGEEKGKGTTEGERRQAEKVMAPDLE